MSLLNTLDDKYYVIKSPNMRYQRKNMKYIFSFVDGRLRFILHFAKQLNFDSYLHRQQLYGMLYFIHVIFSMSIVVELNKNYSICLKFQKSVKN